MKEKDFQVKFSRWAKYNIKRSAAFELKFVKGHRLAFDKIAPHQIQNLLTAKHGTLIYKISDSTIGQKPFDCFALVKSDAFLVVMFHENRGEKEFYMIDVDVLISWKENNTSKSITRDEVKQIGSAHYLA